MPKLVMVDLCTNLIRMKYFDYIFYRVHLFYGKRNDAPNLTAVLFILILQSCVLLLIITTINSVTNQVGSKSYLDKNFFWSLYWALIIVFLIFDIVRYVGAEKIMRLSNFFRGTRLDRLIPIWAIFLQPLIVVTLAVLIDAVVKQAKW